MDTKTKLKQLPISGYSYERFVSSEEISRLIEQRKKMKSEIIIAIVQAGCIKIEAVLFGAKQGISLGYDIYVRENLTSKDWICYDNLPEEVRYYTDDFECEMMTVMNDYVESKGLSYTENSFEIVSGKTVKENGEVKIYG